MNNMATSVNHSISPELIAPRIIPHVQVREVQRTDQRANNKSNSSVLLASEIDELICIICEKPFTDTVFITSCAHRFCKNCILPLITQTEKRLKHCPRCEMLFNKRNPVARDRYYDKLIDALQLNRNERQRLPFDEYSESSDEDYHLQNGFDEATRAVIDYRRNKAATYAGRQYVNEEAQKRFEAGYADLTSSKFEVATLTASEKSQILIRAEVPESDDSDIEAYPYLSNVFPKFDSNNLRLKFRKKTVNYKNFFCNRVIAFPPRDARLIRSQPNAFGISSKYVHQHGLYKMAKRAREEDKSYIRDGGGATEMRRNMMADDSDSSDEFEHRQHFLSTSKRAFLSEMRSMTPGSQMSDCDEEYMDDDDESCDSDCCVHEETKRQKMEEKCNTQRNNGTTTVKEKQPHGINGSSQVLENALRCDSTVSEGSEELGISDYASGSGSQETSNAADKSEGSVLKKLIDTGSPLFGVDPRNEGVPSTEDETQKGRRRKNKTCSKRRVEEPPAMKEKILGILKKADEDFDMEHNDHHHQQAEEEGSQPTADETPVSTSENKVQHQRHGDGTHRLSSGASIDSSTSSSVAEERGRRNNDRPQTAIRIPSNLRQRPGIPVPEFVRIPKSEAPTMVSEIVNVFELKPRAGKKFVIRRRPHWYKTHEEITRADKMWSKDSKTPKAHRPCAIRRELLEDEKRSYYRKLDEEERREEMNSSAPMSSMDGYESPEPSGSGEAHPVSVGTASLNSIPQKHIGLLETRPRYQQNYDGRALVLLPNRARSSFFDKSKQLQQAYLVMGTDGASLSHVGAYMWRKIEESLKISLDAQKVKIVFSPVAWMLKAGAVTILNHMNEQQQWRRMGAVNGVLPPLNKEHSVTPPSNDAATATGRLSGTATDEQKRHAIQVKPQGNGDSILFTFTIPLVQIDEQKTVEQLYSQYCQDTSGILHLVYSVVDI